MLTDELRPQLGVGNSPLPGEYAPVFCRVAMGSQVLVESRKPSTVNSTSYWAHDARLGVAGPEVVGLVDAAVRRRQGFIQKRMGIEIGRRDGRMRDWVTGSDRVTCAGNRVTWQHVIG